MTALAANFDSYVAQFGQGVPFQRFGQWEYHRETIDRRRHLGSVTAALHNEAFLDSLYKTLQAWGIGRRASRLIERAEFGRALQRHEETLEGLEVLSIEDGDLDTLTAGRALSVLIEDLEIVDNVSKIVPGSKAVHHLLPDLMPPLDRRWSGLFFRWQPTDPQQAHERIFLEAFINLANVASATQPSRLVDSSWNTSSSKVLDNALIGFCQVELGFAAEPAPTEPETDEPESLGAPQYVRPALAPPALPKQPIRRGWFGGRRAL